MKILWRNVFAIFLIAIAVVTLITNRHEVSAFLSTMGAIGGHYSAEDKFIGMLAYGLSLVSILAALKIVLNRRSNDR